MTVGKLQKQEREAQKIWDDRIKTLAAKSKTVEVKKPATKPATPNPAPLKNTKTASESLGTSEPVKPNGVKRVRPANGSNTNKPA